LSSGQIIHLSKFSDGIEMLNESGHYTLKNLDTNCEYLSIKSS